jgi:hypothetical protein
MVNIFRYQIACDFHDPARPEERLYMQPPTRLYIIGCLPAIDAVIAEEIVGQFAHRDALMRRPDESIGADFSKALAQDSSRNALVLRASRFTK